MREQLVEITIRFEHLQEAEDNYYFTSKYVLEIVNRAFELFVSSEVEEKRQLIKLILSNLRMEGEKYRLERRWPAIRSHVGRRMAGKIGFEPI